MSLQSDSSEHRFKRKGEEERERRDKAATGCAMLQGMHRMVMWAHRDSTIMSCSRDAMAPSKAVGPREQSSFDDLVLEGVQGAGGPSDKGNTRHDGPDDYTTYCCPSATVRHAKRKQSSDNLSAEAHHEDSSCTSLPAAGSDVHDLHDAGDDDDDFRWSSAFLSEARRVAVAKTSIFGKAETCSCYNCYPRPLRPPRAPALKPQLARSATSGGVPALLLEEFEELPRPPITRLYLSLDSLTSRDIGL